MRSASSVRVEVADFGLWRAAIAVLLSLACANLAVWAWQALPEPEGRNLPLVMVAGATLALGIAASALRGSGFVLAFDGSAWQLTWRTHPGRGVAGRLRVALDLGVWLLLRFEPDPASGRRLLVWLPVQRAGLEPHWHALRAAVYSARPAAASTSSPQHPPASTTPNEP